MNFFEQLSSSGDVDITLRIMKKNDKLTINVMPGSGQSVTKPIIITGTPAELDSGFFTTLYPEVKEISGIISNIKEVKKESEEALKKEKDKSATRKVGNEGKSGNKDKKAAVKKKEAPKADLFGQAEDEPETNNTTDEEQSEDLDNTAE